MDPLKVEYLNRQMRGYHEEKVISDMRKLPTTEAREQYATEEIEKDITKYFYLSDPSRPYIFFRVHFRYANKIHWQIDMQKLKKRVVPTIDKDSPATWYMDQFGGLHPQKIKHISIVYPFKFEKTSALDGLTCLETIFLDYTARFPFLEDSPQVGIAEQKINRANRAAWREARREGIEFEKESFDWDAGNILKELFHGNLFSIRRVVLKISPPGYVDAYGNSANDMIRTISEGLMVECPRIQLDTSNKNVQYCIWK